MTEKKKATPIYLDEDDKALLASIASRWGVSQSAAVQRLIREKGNPPDVATVKRVDVALLPFLGIMDFGKLPTSKGIYFVTDHLGEVSYIGKAGGAKGLKGRWTKVRAVEFVARGAVFIRYMSLDSAEEIDAVESEFIQRFNPKWNLAQPSLGRSDMSYLAKPGWEVPDEYG